MKRAGNKKKYRYLVSLCLVGIMFLSGCRKERDRDFTLQTKVREVMEDPGKENTGLFFFRGNPGEKFAVTNAGGGFAYVAAMHDSFPHALELSKKGYNAFALIYRPDAQAACEDLARAITYPAPGAVIMQYTGLSEVTGKEPPTYACVGTRDGIASYRIMENRIRQIQAQGTDAQIEVFEGLSHGFGLGEHTVAEGWFDTAVSFWERNMK